MQSDNELLVSEMQKKKQQQQTNKQNKTNKQTNKKKTGGHQLRFRDIACGKLPRL